MPLAETILQYLFPIPSIIIGFTCVSNMHVLQLTPESRLLYVRVWALDLNEKARKFNKQHELAPMVYLLGTVSIHQTKLGIFETMHLTWIMNYQLHSIFATITSLKSSRCMQIIISCTQKNSDHHTMYELYIACSSYILQMFSHWKKNTFTQQEIYAFPLIWFDILIT